MGGLPWIQVWAAVFVNTRILHEPLVPCLLLDNLNGYATIEYLATLAMSLNFPPSQFVNGFERYI